MVELKANKKQERNREKIVHMCNFQKIELKDKEWMDPLIAAADMGGCHQNFTNIFAWAKILDFRVSRLNGYLEVKGGTDRKSTRLNSSHH